MSLSGISDGLSQAKRIAFSFKPTFRACDLALICNFPSEKTELQFVLKYWPFSQYKPKISNNHEKKNELKSCDKDLIKQEWKSQISCGLISFDDEKVIDKVSESVKKNFVLYHDEDSSEMKFGSKTEDLSSPSNFGVQEQLYNDRLNFELESYNSIVKKNIYFERGNLFETSIIEAVNKKENMKFVQDKSLKSVDFGLFKICGILDGIDLESRTVIEVKTRSSFVSSQKKTVSLKEKLQCLCYMKLTDCVKCLLVESDSQGEQNIIRINWDESEFEKRVLEKLRKFVIKYRNLEEKEFKLKVRKYSNYL